MTTTMNLPIVLCLTASVIIVVVAGAMDMHALNVKSARGEVVSSLLSWIDQRLEIEETVTKLRDSLTQLRNNYDALVASSTAATETHAHFRRIAALKLEQLKGSSLLDNNNVVPAAGIGTPPLQRRSMSEEKCVVGSSTGPELSVRGVCSCAHGLLVEGRNITQELDAAAAAAALAAVSETATERPSATTTDLPASASSSLIPNCTVSNNASVVGGVINTTYLNGAYGLALTPDEKYAVVTGYMSNSLAILNVAEPANPSIVGGVADLRLTSPTTVAISPNGKYAFVGAYQSNEFVVVDIATDMAKPSIPGRFTARSPMGVAASLDGDFVYLTSYHNPTLTVVNVSDPTNPTQTGIVSDAQSLAAGYWLTMSKDGKYVYVPSAANVFTVVNVSHPSEPTVVGTYRDSHFMKHPIDVAVSPNGQIAFVSLYYGGLTVINVTDPTSPTRIGFMAYSTYNQGVTVSPDGKYVFLAAIDGIETVDVHTDVTAPKIVGSAVTHDAYYEGREIAISADGNSLFVASYTGKAILTVEWGSC